MPGETPVAKYAVGDTIGDGSNVITIIRVNKLKSGGYSYATKHTIAGKQFSYKNTFKEKDLDELISNYGFKLRQKTPTTTDADVEPDTTFDALNEKDR